MKTMPLKWKVKPILDKHNITPYRLMVESKLARAVVYAIANNDHNSLDMRVIEKLIPTLRRLTKNNHLQIGDVVEWVSSDAH
jgi:hypothetical protein